MKTTLERLMSIAETIELWQGGHITDARAFMFVNGITSAHIHDRLVKEVTDEARAIDRQAAIKAQPVQWKQIEIN